MYFHVLKGKKQWNVFHELSRQLELRCISFVISLHLFVLPKFYAVSTYYLNKVIFKLSNKNF